MVEGQQPVKKHENAVGYLEIVLGQVGQLFQLAHGIMRKKPYRARSEWRESRNMAVLMLAQQSIKDTKDRAFHVLFLPTLFQYYLISPSSQHHVGTCAKERVSANLLPTFHRLQQKSMRFLSSNAQKRGDRGSQVRGYG